MSYLEEPIPELTNAAFKQPYWAALASGSSLLVSEEMDKIQDIRQVFFAGKLDIQKNKHF